MSLARYRAAEIAAEVVKSVLANESCKLMGARGSGLEPDEAAKQDALYLSTLLTALTENIYAAGQSKSREN